MRGVEVDTRSTTTDPATRWETRSMTFTYRADPRSFYQFLGAQVRSCVFRPTRVFAENFLEFQDEEVTADFLTMEITNICETGEGLDDVPTGYAFSLRLRYRDRWESEEDPREALVEAIGDALGVDVAEVGTVRLEAAMEAARQVLIGGSVP